MALSNTQLRVQLSSIQSKTLDLSSPQATVALSLLESIAAGTADDQADIIWGDTRTIDPSSSETLDFGTGGGLVDALGDAFEPVEIVALLILAAAANTNNVVVGDAAAEPFLAGMGGTTPTEALQPGGALLWYAGPTGWTVTNNTNDKLKVANSGAGTSVTYSILVLARSVES